MNVYDTYNLITITTVLWDLYRFIHQQTFKKKIRTPAAETLTNSHPNFLVPAGSRASSRALGQGLQPPPVHLQIRSQQLPLETAGLPMVGLTNGEIESCRSRVIDLPFRRMGDLRSLAVSGRFLMLIFFHWKSPLVGRNHYSIITLWSINIDPGSHRGWFRLVSIKKRVFSGSNC